MVVAGERGGQKFDEVLSAPRPVRLVAMPAAPTTPRDTSPGPAAPADRQSSLPAGGAGEALHVCERCGEPLPPGLRSEARYCSKRCRQATSRARLKHQRPKPPIPAARELHLVRRADARRSARGGPVLLKALPAGVLAARCQGAEASRTRAGGAAAVKLERVQPGDVVRCAIKGRTGIYGEVTEINDGIVYFRPLCPATGWRHASAREVVGHWRKAERRGGGDDTAPAVPREQLSLPGVHT